MTTTILPTDKLWKLLELGLADLAKQEAAPDSCVDMGDWLSLEGTYCRACLAGSVMRFSLGMMPRTNCEIAPHHVADYLVCDALDALDSLRCGCVCAACEYLGHEITIDQACKLDRHVTPYSIDPAAWHRDMAKLLADLKEADL